MVLFKDAFDSEKYAITPTKLCITGFAMFKDSGHKEQREANPIDEERNGSSDEVEKMDKVALRMDISGPRSRDKRKLGGNKKKENTTKIFERELSYSVDRSTSASEKLVAKIDNLVGPDVPNLMTYMKE